MKVKQLLPLTEPMQMRESIRTHYYKGRIWNFAGIALTDRGTLAPVISDGLHIMLVTEEAEIEKLDPQTIYDED